MKIKNSNKILILIGILTVAIPILVAQVFLHKIRNNQFEYERNVHTDHPELNMEGSLTGVKVIKLVGTGFPELLAAAILHSDLNNYVVSRDRREDSMVIHHKGDTLVFKYDDVLSSKNRFKGHNQINLRLNLPGNMPVYAENCLVGYGAVDGNIDHNSTHGPADFYLSNGAVLELGTKILMFKTTTDTVIAGIKAGTALITDTTKATKDSINRVYANIGAVHVHANNSTVRLMQALNFDNLSLEMRDSSTLDLQHPFKAKSVSADIDPKTNVLGNYQSIQSMASWKK